MMTKDFLINQGEKLFAIISHNGRLISTTPYDKLFWSSEDTSLWSSGAYGYNNHSV